MAKTYNKVHGNLDLTSDRRISDGTSRPRAPFAFPRFKAPRIPYSDPRIQNRESRFRIVDSRTKPPGDRYRNDKSRNQIPEASYQNPEKFIPFSGTVMSIDDSDDQNQESVLHHEDSDSSPPSSDSKSSATISESRMSNSHMEESILKLDD